MAWSSPRTSLGAHANEKRQGGRLKKVSLVVEAETWKAAAVGRAANVVTLRAHMQTHNLLDKEIGKKSFTPREGQEEMVIPDHPLLLGAGHEHWKSPSPKLREPQSFSQTEAEQGQQKRESSSPHSPIAG